MLSAKTVFIVGAGASYEVGLPVGMTLKNVIAKKLDIRLDDSGSRLLSGDAYILDTILRRDRANMNVYLNSCWQIRDGIPLSPSIDDFIDAHQHDGRIAVCGKLAIAQSILEAERSSKLFFNSTDQRGINFDGIQDTWYVDFYQLLSQKVTKESLSQIFDNVTIICFNYDRCIEHFLVHALATHWHISVTDSYSLVSQLKIFHPYGMVGEYLPGKVRMLPFGNEHLPSFDEVISSVRTYTERVEAAEELAAMRHAVQDAEALVFLGCAYHPNNMGLLLAPGVVTKTERVFATRKGISEADLPIVEQTLAKLRGLTSSAYVHYTSHNFAQTCKDLFSDYRMALRQ